MPDTEVAYYDVGAVEMMLDGARMAEPCQAELAAVVQALTARGMTGPEIAEKTGLLERRVYRLRKMKVEPMPDEDVYDASAEREAALERMAILAMNAACEIRNDPHEVWELLVRMEPQPMRELVMALACMVPVDSTVKELLGWIEDREGE